mgnify:CR=1 FL=1|jgi:hypothetical protein
MCRASLALQDLAPLLGANFSKPPCPSGMHTSQARFTAAHCISAVQNFTACCSSPTESPSYPLAKSEGTKQLESPAIVENSGDLAAPTGSVGSIFCELY